MRQTRYIAVTVLFGALHERETTAQVRTHFNFCLENFITLYTRAVPKFLK